MLAELKERALALGISPDMVDAAEGAGQGREVFIPRPVGTWFEGDEDELIELAWWYEVRATQGVYETVEMAVESLIHAHEMLSLIGQTVQSAEK